MVLKRRISLDGVQLDELADEIIIHGITESAPQYSLTALDNGNGIGQTVVAKKRSSLDIKVDFGIAVKAGDESDLKTRADIFQKVVSWAMTAESGTWLKVNYRENQQIMAVLSSVPALSDVCDWAEDMSMTFRAYLPYWQSTGRTASTYNSTNRQTVLLKPDGNLKTPLFFTLTNPGSGTLNTASVSCGSRTMSFANLGLTSGEKLVVSYSSGALQNLGIYDSDDVLTSPAAPKRSVSSDDDIWLKPAEDNTVNIASDIAGNWSLSYISRWS